MAFYAEIHQSHKSHLPQCNEDQNSMLEGDAKIIIQIFLKV